MVKKVRVSEAKAHLSALMARAGYVGERYLIERRGDPLAAPVGVEDLERLEALSNLMKRAPANALVTGLAHVPPEDQSTSSVTRVAAIALSR